MGTDEATGESMTPETVLAITGIVFLFALILAFLLPIVMFGVLTWSPRPLEWYRRYVDYWMDRFDVV